MSSNWFLLRGGQKFGPYQIEQIAQFAKEGRIQHEDMLWSESLSEWTPAAKVPGIQLAQPTPEISVPAPKNSSAQAPTKPLFNAPATGHHQAPTTEVKSSSGRGCLLFVILLLALLLLLAAGASYFLLAQSSPPERPSPSGQTQDQVRHQSTTETSPDTPHTKLAPSGDKNAQELDTTFSPVWIDYLVATESEMEVGSSTRVSVGIHKTDGRSNSSSISWNSTCGAIVPMTKDDSQAIFFAPPTPGWCNIKVGIRSTSVQSIEQSIEILVTPSLSDSFSELP